MDKLNFDLQNIRTSARTDVKMLQQQVAQVKIRVEELNAFYGSNQVLHRINWEIPHKKITAIIGPSGCGKSTLLRCLNRLHELKPNARAEGRVYLDGMNIYNPYVNVIQVRRKIGMVFQKPNPFPFMSIYDNVAAGLLLQGKKKNEEMDMIVEEALQMAALWDEVKDDLNKPGSELSGGQQQRLCIARALALKPEVLLLDEPTSALDPISTKHIENLLLDLKEHYTIVIVTHNLQQAARIADYVAFMYLGQLIEFAPTDVIFSQPEHELTRDYVMGRFG